MPYARDVQSTAQTDKELVAAPGANRQIEVLSVIVSTDTAQVVTLESGADSLRNRFYMAANSTVVIPACESAAFRCAANQALTYTSSAAGNVFVQVEYRQTRASGV